MDYIKPKDEELVKSLTLMINMPSNKEKTLRILGILGSHFKDNPDNIEAIFSYGLSNHLLISKELKAGNTVDAVKIKLTLDIYNDAIRLAPNYWLVYLFKGIFLLTLPESTQDSDELLKTIVEMFNLQSLSETHYSYFLIPYIMAADYSVANNDLIAARLYFDKAKLLDNIQKVRFECLGKCFKEILENFEYRLAHSCENALIDITMEFRQYFY